MRTPLTTVLLAALLVGGSATGGVTQVAGRALAVSAGGGSPAWVTGPGPVDPNPAASCAQATFDALTRDQRIGQVFMLSIGGHLTQVQRSLVAQYHFGSMLITRVTGFGVAGVATTARHIQNQAGPVSTGNVGFLVAANQEGGYIQPLNGPGFADIPTAVQQGKMSPATLRKKAAMWGHDLAQAGINLDLAPVGDVVPPGTSDQNPPIGQLDREYGHFAGPVADHVVAFIRGMRDAGIATAVKHFPGLGRVTANTDHTSDVVDTVTTRHSAYLKPFQAAVDAGVPFVMVSLAIYTKIDPLHLAAFAPTIVGGMLHDDLGFRGVVISDSLSAAAAEAYRPGTRAIDFIRAGGDLIVVSNPDAARLMQQALSTRGLSNPEFQARLDDATMHVLRQKDAMGLLPCSG